MSDYLTLPKRSEQEARRDMSRMSDREFYCKLCIANEFEKLATEMRGRSETMPYLSVIQAVEQRASRLRGELQREADRQATAERDRDERPWTAGNGGTE